MKKGLHRIYPIAAALFLAAGASHAELQVARVFGDHMVMQRGVSVPVWGMAEPSEKITVSFAGQEIHATRHAHDLFQQPAARGTGRAGRDHPCVGGDPKETAGAAVHYLQNSGVPKPVAVRYCWELNPPEPFLYNKAGLPAPQFRTDDWVK